MNITTSILKHYNVETKFSTLKIIDDELNKGYRNVILILVDALGNEIIEKHKDVCKNIISDRVDVLTSVFPPTTVAATTSILTGKPPVNTGWIGWLQYIKEEDRSIIFFYNKDFYNNDYEPDYNVSERYAPIKKIYELIEEKNEDVITYEVFPEFREPEHKTFKDLLNKVKKHTEEDGKHFIYAYWDKVDTYLHSFGTESEKVHKHIEEVNNTYLSFINSLNEDTLVILTADHGMIDIEEVPLWDYEDVVNTFEHNPSIEARATAFFIKDGMKEQFEEAFNRNFREKFVLYKSEDFLASKILGDAKEQTKIREFLGDYVSIAIDKYSFKLSNSDREFKGQHAGLTKEEVLIPLVIYSPKK
jgi:predicted AlkP superfamily pyrophosphatase or phosphodiesterase